MAPALRAAAERARDEQPHLRRALRRHLGDRARVVQGHGHPAGRREDSRRPGVGAGLGPVGAAVRRTAARPRWPRWATSPPPRSAWRWCRPPRSRWAGRRRRTAGSNWPAPPLQDDSLKLGAADPARSATGLLALTQLSTAAGGGRGRADAGRGDDEDAVAAHLRQRRAAPGHAAARRLGHRAGQPEAQPGAGPVRAGLLHVQRVGRPRRRPGLLLSHGRFAAARLPLHAGRRDAADHGREPGGDPVHDLSAPAGAGSC